MYAEYYKGKIKQFNELAEYAAKNNNKEKATFYSEEAKQFSSRLMQMNQEKFEARNGK